MPSVPRTSLPIPVRDREKAPLPKRETPQAGTERRQAPERPTPVTKSPEDLKAILRTMTTKTGAEREQKQMENKQSLKGALAEVLGKGTVPPIPAKAPEGRLPDTPSSEASRTPDKKPFEIPEDTLRKVLKGDT